MLIKVTRNEPEFVGGPVEAYVSEQSLPEALANGWTKADDKKVEKEVKVEEPKPVEKEEKVEEKVEAPKKAKKTL